ncbi:MAG: hypothetical protein V4666_11610 [Bacteroidota bacterium]
MKTSNQTKIYIYTALLFTSTFLTAVSIIRGFKNNDFNYIWITASLLMSISFIIQIIKLGKIENNK